MQNYFNNEPTLRDCDGPYSIWAGMKHGTNPGTKILNTSMHGSQITF